MKIFIVTIALVGIALSAPAFADAYPVSGKWGVSASTDKGPIDCSKLRVINFNDDFTTGQIRNGHVNYTPRQVDADYIEMSLEKAGLLKLRKCK